ncbi:MAG: hypothetical protein H6724_15585 [Sandaracinus sp.]|nr:hypothetical protein [Sandaracinus sp.]
MRTFLLVLVGVFVVLDTSSAQSRESVSTPGTRPPAAPVDEARIAELANVGRTASAEARRTLDARVLPFELTWGLQ